MNDPTVPAGIVLTPHALSRHAKRLRTLLEQHNVALTVTQSQEAFARVLGMKNWHEAQTLCAKVTSRVPVSSASLESRSPFWHPSLSLAPIYPDPPCLFTPQDWDAFLAWAVMQGAITITIQTNEAIFIETRRGLSKVIDRSLTMPDVTELADHLYGEGGVLRRCGHQDINFGCEIRPSRHERVRFRVNAVGIWSNGRQGFQLTLRPVLAEPPSLHDIAMPAALTEAMRKMDQGLVLITGETGDGRTTSLAALMRDCLEQNPSARGVTLEDPIEYTYDRLDISGRVAQSEVGRHVPSFKEGVRNALRRRPSVIMLDQCRDAETLNAVIEATLTGHRVFTSLHAYSVSNALRRMVGVWEEKERRARWFDLIQSMRVVVNQRLYFPHGKDEDQALHMRWEYLILDDATRSMLLDLSPEQIPAKVEELIKTRGTQVTAVLG